MSDKTKPEEFWTPERCFITELLNRADYPEVSVARARVEPGVTTQLHALDVAEWYVIESGTGRVSVADRTARDVRAGDVVQIPRGAAQQIHNCGDRELLFLCICTPRFLPAHYTSLE